METADSASSTLATRLLDIYRAPGRVYEALQKNGGEWYDWIVPTLFAAAFWAMYNAVALGTPQDVPHWDTLTEVERQQALDAMEMWRSHVWFSLPLVNSFASMAAGALVMVPIIRWTLRREVTLRQMLAVKAYASLVVIPRWLLLVICYRLGAEDVNFGPAAFLSEAARATVTGQIMTGLDLFDLWQAVTAGIGIACMAQREPRAGIALSVGLWLAWLILGSLTSLLPTAPPTPT